MLIHEDKRLLYHNQNNNEFTEYTGTEFLGWVSFVASGVACLFNSLLGGTVAEESDFISDPTVDKTVFAHNQSNIRVKGYMLLNRTI